MAELTKQTITVEHVTLVRRIRTACLNGPNRFPAAVGIASHKWRRPTAAQLL